MKPQVRVVIVSLLLITSIPALAVGVGASSGSSLSSDASISDSASISDDTGSDCSAEKTGTIVNGDRHVLGESDAVDGSIEMYQFDRTTEAKPSVMATQENVIHRSIVLRHLPDRPGEFEVEITVEIPAAVTELTLGPGDDVNVKSTEDFERGTDGYDWTQQTQTPSIRYVVDANQSGTEGRLANPAAESEDLSNHQVNASDHDEYRPATSTHRQHGDNGEGYTFVDTGSWGLVEVPGTDLGWSQTESVGTSESITVDGPGAVGGNIAYFGPVTEHERVGDGETIRLVVPERAALEVSPEAILDSLEQASQSLRVGARSAEVFVVAAPTGDVEWAVDGIQTGDSDAWVRDDSPLDEAGSVWLHEYVHTRQGFITDATPTDEALWLVEAQAEYYAALLGLEAGEITFDAFRSYLERGIREPHDDAILVDPSTWRSDRSDYVKGALVYGEIDRQLRLETDGGATLEDVFSSLNRAEEPITQEILLTELDALGGTPVREAAEQYTETSAVPSMWSGSEHEAAFDQATPIFETGIDQTMSFQIETETLQAGADVAIPSGQSITVPVVIENVGDQAGTGDVMLSVDGSVVDRHTVTSSPGDRAEETLSWTPEQPGQYELRVGADRFSITAHPPERPGVTGLAVDPETVAPGESTTITATLENDGDVPRVEVVQFRTVEGTVAEEFTTIEPGERATVETELAFDDPSRYEVAVGNVTTMVTVDSSSITGEDVPGGEQIETVASQVEDGIEAVPGFGLMISMIGLVVVLGILARRV